MTTDGFSHIALNPFSALKTAVAKVPQLKYALAVIGVSAVVAIVLTWISDPKIAVFGIVITIALMYVLAIFAQSVGSIRGLQWLAAFIAWSVAILFVVVLVLLTTSYALGVPKTLSDRLFRIGPSTIMLPTPSPEPEIASLSGTVVDQNDKPLQGAKVTLDEIPGMLPVETSSDGVFNIKEIAKKYGEGVRVRVVIAGYEPNPYTEDVVLGKAPPLIKLTRKR
jgi:hypothetical protein